MKDSEMKFIEIYRFFVRWKYNVVYSAFIVSDRKFYLFLFSLIRLQRNIVLKVSIFIKNMLLVHTTFCIGFIYSIQTVFNGILNRIIHLEIFLR